jgi:hypothetical protein
MAKPWPTPPSMPSSAARTTFWFNNHLRHDAIYWQPGLVLPKQRQQQRQQDCLTTLKPASAGLARGKLVAHEAFHLATHNKANNRTKQSTQVFM